MPSKTKTTKASKPQGASKKTKRPDRASSKTAVAVVEPSPNLPDLDLPKAAALMSPPTTVALEPVAFSEPREYVDVTQGTWVNYVNGESEVCEALVCRLLNRSGGSVNLAVFDQDGNHSNAKSVEFSGVDPAKHAAYVKNTWHWKGA